MCRRVKCSKCGKATFAGCGAHVEQVLAGIPADGRCKCRTDDTDAASGTASAPRKWWPFA